MRGLEPGAAGGVAADAKLCTAAALLVNRNPLSSEAEESNKVGIKEMR